jgi:hypothetical protein
MEDWDEMNRQSYVYCCNFSEDGKLHVKNNEQFGCLADYGDIGMREATQQAETFNQSIQMLVKHWGRPHSTAADSETRSQQLQTEIISRCKHSVTHCASSYEHGSKQVGMKSSFPESVTDELVEVGKGDRSLPASSQSVLLDTSGDLEFGDAEDEYDL